MTEEQWALEPHPVLFVYPEDHRARLRDDLASQGCPLGLRDQAVEVAFDRYYKHVEFPQVWFSH